jgi:hypothetical protein
MKAKSVSDWALEAARDVVMDASHIPEVASILVKHFTQAQEEALREAAEVVSQIKWGYDGDCGAEQAILSLITTKETK